MMDFADSLTFQERERGQRLYRLFAWLNPVSVTCLMDNVLILYGIRNGLDDAALAALASFPYLAMPLMFLGRPLISRFGNSRAMAVSWFVRYLFALIMLPAPWFAVRGQPGWAAAAILAGAFGLFAWRSVGMVSSMPMLGDLTTARERGRLISGNWLRYSVMSLAMTLLVVFGMRRWSSTGLYQGLILLGCAVGFWASYVLSRIPESRQPGESARQPVSDALRTVWVQPRRRRLLFAWAAGLTAVMLVNPFAMIALKNGYGVPDHTALFFSLLYLAGGLMAALILGVVADHTGPRPLLILDALGLVAVSLFWSLAPGTAHGLVIGAAFVAGGFCAAGINISLAHYFLSTVPERDRVGVGLFMNMLSGAAAGLAGSLFGGTVLRLLRLAVADGMPIYNLYFRLVLAILLVLLLVIVRLERLQEWRIQRVVGLFFSFRDLRTLFALNQLSRAVSPTAEVAHAGRLGEIGSRLSEEALLQALESARLSVRGAALSALRQIEFGPRTVETLITELSRSEHTTAWMAAEILGEHGCREAIPALRQALETEDVFLRGKCMIALARLGDVPSYRRLAAEFVATRNPRILIQGAEALVRTGDRAYLPLLLQRAAAPELSGAVRDALLDAIAEFCGQGELFYLFLRRSTGVTDPAKLLAAFADVAGPLVLPPAVRGRLADAVAGPQAETRLRQIVEACCRRSQSVNAEAVQIFLRAAPDTPLGSKLAYCLMLCLESA